MENYLLFLPLWGALIGGGICTLLITIFYCTETVRLKCLTYLARSFAKGLSNELNFDEEVAFHLKKIDLQEALDKPIEERFNAYIETIKKRIPVSAFFLQGSTLDELKMEAKIEAFKMIPDVKESLIDQCKRQFKDEKFLNEAIEKLSLKPLFKQPCKWLSVFGISLGFLIGAFLSFCLLILQAP